MRQMIVRCLLAVGLGGSLAGTAVCTCADEPGQRAEALKEVDDFPWARVERQLLEISQQVDDPMGPAFLDLWVEQNEWLANAVSRRSPALYFEMIDKGRDGFVFVPLAGLFAAQRLDANLGALGAFRLSFDTALMPHWINYSVEVLYPMAREQWGAATISEALLDKLADGPTAIEAAGANRLAYAFKVAPLWDAKVQARQLPAGLSLTGEAAILDAVWDYREGEGIPISEYMRERLEMYSHVPGYPLVVFTTYADPAHRRFPTAVRWLVAKASEAELSGAVEAEGVWIGPILVRRSEVLEAFSDLDELKLSPTLDALLRGLEEE